MGNFRASSHTKTNGLSLSPSGNLTRYSSWGRQSTIYTHPSRQLVGYCNGNCNLSPVRERVSQPAQHATSNSSLYPWCANKFITYVAQLVSLSTSKYKTDGIQ